MDVFTTTHDADSVLTWKCTLRVLRWELQGRLGVDVYVYAL